MIVDRVRRLFPIAIFVFAALAIWFGSQKESGTIRTAAPQAQAPIGAAETNGLDTPKLLGSEGSMNIVAYRGVVFGVPMALGAVDWTNGTVGILPGVLQGSKFENVVAQVKSNPVAREAPGGPKLVRTEGTYNLVVFQGLAFALPLSLGHVEWSGRPVHSLPGVIVAGTMEEVLARIRQP